ncbi:MAG: hypothetical protein BMS9Abin05_2644 [Rhodothermia bacterium]|nr:MAG: hypothetical protein BMS9Abin05_2644 [Rhodothermia bacterium]
MKYKTPIISLLTAFLMTITLVPQVSAQDKQATAIENPDVVVQVKGMTCEMCAYNMEKHLKQIDAIGDVQVILDEQKVLLTLNEEEAVAEYVLRDAVKNAVLDAGFTVEAVTFMKEDETSKAGPEEGH